MAIRARMIRVQSAKEAATEVIRGLIHSGEIGAGERISIEALASTLGVSRTPVREALWQLSVEGLVTIQPRVGVLVREIEDQEVLDIYRIKGVLEPLMAEWAAERGTPGQRQQIYDSVDELDAAAEADDVTRYVALLEERRASLLAIANSSALQDSLGILEGRVRLLRFRNLSRPGQLDRSARQHRSIAKAIRDGDPAAAGKAQQVHMQDAMSRVRALLASGRRGVADQDGAASSQGSQ
jgi:DNA-binding GntR family transcriptional regulator